MGYRGLLARGCASGSTSPPGRDPWTSASRERVVHSRSAFVMDGRTQADLVVLWVVNVGMGSNDAVLCRPIFQFFPIAIRNPKPQPKKPHAFLLQQVSSNVVTFFVYVCVWKHAMPIRTISKFECPLSLSPPSIIYAFPPLLILVVLQVPGGRWPGLKRPASSSPPAPSKHRRRYDGRRPITGSSASGVSTGYGGVWGEGKGGVYELAYDVRVAPAPWNRTRVITITSR